MFLEGCKAYGLKSQDIFQVNDLYENKNLYMVVDCIFALGGMNRKPTEMLRNLTVFLAPKSLARNLSAAAAEQSATANVVPFRTTENNPVNHGEQHRGRFYAVPAAQKQSLFTYGGIPKSLDSQYKVFQESTIMVRSPAVEVIEYLQKTGQNYPAMKYVIYGKEGTGKTMTLAHVLHYGVNSDHLLVHVPWAPNWVRRFKEVVPSVYKPGRFDHPYEATEWLNHFATQNSQLLKKLDLKTHKEYTWSKRENTPQGSPLMSLVEQGVNRNKYATDCVGALIKELKQHANEANCKLLVAIDGFNAFLVEKSRAVREDKTPISPLDFSLVQSFLSLTKSDWVNGSVVLTVDTLATTDDQRESHFPRYLLGKKGFELLDPFVPVEVNNFDEKEITSMIDYYIDRRWLQQPKAHTEQGRLELAKVSGYNPWKLMEIVAPY
nr:EOG090X05V1 [Eulimnadia texana]